jgi:ankyrin repeat protein
MTQETNEQLQKLLNDLGAKKALLPPQDKERAMSLIRQGADLRTCAKTLDYKTLFHHLVLTNKDGINDPELTELLKTIGTVDIRDGYGCSALMVLIDQVQKKQCTLADFKRTAMLLARHDANLNLYGTIEPHRTLVHQLVLTNEDGVNELELIELLKARKAIVQMSDGTRRSPLSALLDQMHLNQCSIEDFKRTAMILARHEADLSVSGTLRRQTLLHYLVLGNQDGANNKEISELLQIRPELISIPDAAGLPPLHALIQSHEKLPVSYVERLIVFAGKSAFTSNCTDGSTLLHTACVAKNLELADYLLNQKLSIEAKTKTGDTVLHAAAKHQDKAMWCWLLKKQVALNAQNDAGQTALHVAVLQGNKVMVEWLIKHGAFLYLRDQQGKTALDLAREKAATELSTLLLSAQNNPLGRLFHAISEMKEYGDHLKTKGVLKGGVATELAVNLYSKAEIFFQKSADDMKREFPQFKQEFSQLLKSKNKELGQYRFAWPTIIANIAIALTGIGALLLVGRLLHSAVAGGRPLFFFQKSRTSGEEQVDNINECVNAMKAG